MKWFATPIAFRPWPCWVRGYPSLAVAADEGVPGVHISVAVIDPPYMAEVYTDVNRTSPAAGVILKVIGMSRATAMVADKPGSAPTVIPPTTTDKARQQYFRIHK